MNVDPLSEMSRKTSPYVYALNNPVYFIDPDGMMAEASNDKSGSDGANSDNYSGMTTGVKLAFGVSLDSVINSGAAVSFYGNLQSTGRKEAEAERFASNIDTGDPFKGEEKKKSVDTPSQNVKEKKGFLQLKDSNRKGAEATVTMNYKINYDDEGNPTYKVLDIKTNMEIRNSPLDKWEDGINDNHPFPTQYTVNNEGKVVFEARGQLTIGEIKFGGISWTLFQYNYRFLGEFNIPKGTGSAVLHRIK